MKKGFTALELVIVIIIFGIATISFFIQKTNLDAITRDNNRKIAINAMYYNLEEAFYPTNNFYPSTIDETNLPAMDPALFTDPFGQNVGAEESSYRYEPAGCNDKGECQSYILRSVLEKESDFVKQSRR